MASSASCRAKRGPPWSRRRQSAGEESAACGTVGSRQNMEGLAHSEGTPTHAGALAAHVEIHRYGRAGVLRLHVEEGGDHLVRKVIIDVIGQEHDPLAIHARVDGDPCGLVHARKLVRHLTKRLWAVAVVVRAGRGQGCGD
eukprot:scaffold13786_cov111-Isochrysis_galbana.AAC.3